MLRTPDWLKNLAPQTKRAPYNPASFSPIARTNNVLSMPKQSVPQGQTGYTGAGFDGVVQPLNRSERRLDEGELVLNAQDAARVGDLVQGIVQASRMGGLSPDTTNAIRKAVGMGGEQRFADGNVPFNPGAGVASFLKSNWLSKDVQDKYNAAQTNTNTVFNNQINAAKSIGTNSVFNDQIAASKVVQNPSGTNTFFNNQIAAAKTAPAPTTTTTNRSVGNQYNTLALGSLRDIASGESPYAKALANQAQQQQALAASARQGELRQDLAQQGLGGTGVGNTAIAQQGIEESRAQAQLAGETAKANMSQMASGAQALAGASATRAGQEYQRSTDELNQLLKSGNIQEYANRFKQVYGTDIDVAALQNADNLSNITRGASAVETQLSVNPQSTVDDPVIKAGLEAVWRGSGKTGPMDAAWAQNYLTNAQNASNPIWRTMNSIPEQQVRDALGIDLANYTSSDGKTTGYAGWQKDFLKFSNEGGLEWSADGKMFTPTQKSMELGKKVMGIMAQQSEGVGAGFVSSTTGPSKINGTEISTDEKGNKIISYDAMSKIGTTQIGDMYNVGDDGTLSPPTSLQIISGAANKGLVYAPAAFVDVPGVNILPPEQEKKIQDEIEKLSNTDIVNAASGTMPQGWDTANTSMKDLIKYLASRVISDRERQARAYFMRGGK